MVPEPFSQAPVLKTYQTELAISCGLTFNLDNNRLRHEVQLERDYASPHTMRLSKDSSQPLPKAKLACQAVPRGSIDLALWFPNARIPINVVPSYRSVVLSQSSMRYKLFEFTLFLANED